MTSGHKPVVFLIVGFLGLYVLVGIVGLFWLASQEVPAPGEIVATIGAALASLGGIGNSLVKSAVVESEGASAR